MIQRENWIPCIFEVLLENSAHIGMTCMKERESKAGDWLCGSRCDFTRDSWRGGQKMESKCAEREFIFLGKEDGM
jgi:hypothetical protein